MKVLTSQGVIRVLYGKVDVVAVHAQAMVDGAPGDGRLLVVVVGLFPFCCCCCCCCSIRCFPHLLRYFQIQLPWLVSLSVRVYDDVVYGGPGELRGKVQREGVVRLGLAKGHDDDVACCCLWWWGGGVFEAESPPQPLSLSPPLQKSLRLGPSS